MWRRRARLDARQEWAAIQRQVAAEGAAHAEGRTQARSKVKGRLSKFSHLAGQPSGSTLLSRLRAARLTASAEDGRGSGMNTTAVATRRATLALPGLLTATLGRAQAPWPDRP